MKRVNRPMRAKKLEIQRETLRQLHDDRLRQIYGKGIWTEGPPQSHNEVCAA